MGDKTQIGARVDSGLYKRFKEAVEKKHGRTRGVLSHEVENALRNYVEADNPTGQISRIENDVATVNARLARIEESVAGADGGSTVPDPGTPSTPAAHTHTEDTVESDSDPEPTSKPHAKAPKSDKLEWIWYHKIPQRPVTAPVLAFDKWVGQCFDFGDRARHDLVRRLFDRYNAKAVKRKRDGTYDVVLADTEEEREARIEQYGEEADRVYVLQEDGIHVEGDRVFDALLK